MKKSEGKPVLRLKYSCKFPGCWNGYYVNLDPNARYKNKHFYKFPSESKKNMLMQWRKICNIGSDVVCNNFYVCEDHFFQTDFMNSSRHRLNNGVIPKHTALVLHKCNPFVDSLCVITSGQNTLSTSQVQNANFGCSDDSSDTEGKQSVAEDELNFTPLSDRSFTQNDTFHLMDDDFNFLSTPLPESSKGIMGSGISKSDLTPVKTRMYKLHRNNISRVGKLKKKLQNERDQLKILKQLYDDQKFQIIEGELNEITKNFINSQLRNYNKASTGMRWSNEDKVFALSIYKRSPRLYRYLSTCFCLPSIRLLKSLLSQIPFDTGLNIAILQVLKTEVTTMVENDKYCALVFDEISLESGLHYEASKQIIYGYEDLGHLGRSPAGANHALVFMLKGIHRTWKQIIAYYFTASTISSGHLKEIIVYIICEMQKIGLKVVSTVCDQNSTNQKALRELCEANLFRSSQFHFVVNNEPVVTVFDVPHLLKNTRNALIGNKIQFELQKEAKFDYISRLFSLDKQKRFKTLPKLKEEHFNFNDSYVKMKVKVAAAQMSHTVAAAIETYVSTGILPSEAIHTAEFVEKIDNLFDSLNSNEQYQREGKMFRCALSNNSPHLEMWYDILKETKGWKIIDLKSGKDKTHMFSFIKGWQTTIKSIIFLWDRLKQVGFKYLNLKAFNQDALENSFCCIRQHGIANTNPTCFQFVQALKTHVVNSMSLPFKTMSVSNCEGDECTPLSNLYQLLTSGNDDGKNLDDNEQESISPCFTDSSSLFESECEDDSQALAYVSGYVLKKLNLEYNCDTCKTALHSCTPTEHHLFTSFKENDEQSRLGYASENLMLFIKSLHDQLYTYLNTYGHEGHIEDRFRELFSAPDLTFCDQHSIEESLLSKAVPFLIYKYVKDKKELRKRKFTAGHAKKVKKFKSM